MTDLIDTTEMYLRTIFELMEDGVVPMRARIAEQLDHSGPTVSQTVARMERDGLVVVTPDRHLELTPEGLELATRVMRKHRLAERLLTDVIGLDLPHVHEEACRWEHVMSDRVERRLIEMLDDPHVSPYGNPIPGLDELGLAEPSESAQRAVVSMDSVAVSEVTKFTVIRIGEGPQAAHGFLDQAVTIGLVPGATVSIQRSGKHVLATVGEESLELSSGAARHVFGVVDLVNRHD